MYSGTEAIFESRPGLAAEEGLARAAPPRRFRRDPPRATESLTDGELVTLALNGAAPAFSRLLERHARHVHRLIARRMRDPDDVLDILQDTRLAVWRALHHYDARRPFEAWVTSIALNKCRDWARRRTAQCGLQLRLEADRHDAGTEGDDVQRQLIGEEGLRRLARALEQLPAQLLAPLVLTVLQEHSQVAAARQLGLTRKAVEMRVRRARRHLEQALRPAPAQPGAPTPAS
ncbi:MAG: RNA polymerase sigma factor [Steroidobacteraceae bacterium]